LAASCVQESKSGDVILKMVNFSNQAKTMKVNLSTFGKILPDATMEVLSGNPEAENTIENPQNIVPVKSTFKAEKSFNYSAPPMSLTVIRINTKR
jgi:alpha-L-arabinofuranosidase